MTLAIGVPGFQDVGRDEAYSLMGKELGVVVGSFSRLPRFLSRPGIDTLRQSGLVQNVIRDRVGNQWSAHW